MAASADREAEEGPCELDLVPNPRAAQGRRSLDELPGWEAASAGVGEAHVRGFARPEIPAGQARPSGLPARLEARARGPLDDRKGTVTALAAETASEESTPGVRALAGVVHGDDGWASNEPRNGQEVGTA
jgi:hypothetical protein